MLAFETYPRDTFGFTNSSKGSFSLSFFSEGIFFDFGKAGLLRERMALIKSFSCGFFILQIIWHQVDLLQKKVNIFLISNSSLVLCTNSILRITVLDLNIVNVTMRWSFF